MNRGLTTLKEGKSQRGLTLVETVIGASILLLVGVSIWQGFTTTLDGISVLRTKNSFITLANEMFEVTRNMPYEDVGIEGGLPDGKIPKTQTIEKDGKTFLITASVVNVDDPFDGLIGQVPNDLSPADNKLVEFVIECTSCSEVDPLTVTSKVAPKNLETAGDNGALFVGVTNANGQPIQGADVEIVNDDADPSFVIEETTNNLGMFQLVDAPPGTETYKIEVTKSGYTTEKTYTPGEIANPFPDKPHANVATGLVTLITFIIDELTEVEFSTKRADCSVIGGVDFDFKGQKTIGEDILKYERSLTTNGSGETNLWDVEWDTYSVDITESNYYLAGSNPFLPFTANPGASQELDLILTNKNEDALLVRVQDGDSGLPVSDAEVTISRGGFSASQITGRGAMFQSDWSGGDNQEQIGDDTRYFSQDGNLETSAFPEEIKLAESGGFYPSSGELTSSTFDTGTTTNFHVLNWKPQAHLEILGEDPVKFQVATNQIVNASTTWEFVGPDGSSSSYYTSSGEPFAGNHNGDRYLRYKAYLSTDSATNTPSVSEISFSFSSGCDPSGQAYFDGLDDGDYEIDVTKSGYIDFNLGSFQVSDGWQAIDVILEAE
jgi:hypothetical protein